MIEHKLRKPYHVINNYVAVFQVTRRTLMACSMAPLGTPDTSPWLFTRRSSPTLDGTRSTLSQRKSKTQRGEPVPHNGRSLTGFGKNMKKTTENILRNLYSALLTAAGYSGWSQKTKSIFKAIFPFFLFDILKTHFNWIGDFRHSKPDKDL